MLLRSSSSLWLARSGIMNGLDTGEWDPSRDALLPPGARFAGHADAARGKGSAKHALQTRTGLHADTTVRSARCLFPPMAAPGVRVAAYLSVLHAMNTLGRTSYSQVGFCLHVFLFMAAAGTAGQAVLRDQALHQEGL
jgi:hypothetical protein